MKNKKMIAAGILACAVLIVGGIFVKSYMSKKDAGDAFLGDAMLEQNGDQEILFQSENEAEAGEGMLNIMDGGVPLAGGPGGGGFDRGREEAVIRLVNEERAKNGLGAVRLDETMMSAAEVRAQEQMSLFSHTRPDGSNAFTVFSQFGIPADYRGENVAYAGNVYGSDGVMGLWMNSQGHKANILNGNFGRIGVGYFEAAGIGYWCQLFAN